MTYFLCVCVCVEKGRGTSSETFVALLFHSRPELNGECLKFFRGPCGELRYHGRESVFRKHDARASKRNEKCYAKGNTPSGHPAAESDLVNETGETTRGGVFYAYRCLFNFNQPE